MGIIHIDPTKPLTTQLDLSQFVYKSADGRDFTCSKCLKVLIRIEPNGILGQALNELDAHVIVDHYLAKHDPMKPS